MNKIKVGLVGYKGRMGKQIISSVMESDEVIISGAVSRKKSAEDIGNVVGLKLGINSSSSIMDVFQKSDVVIEFTTPDTMKECLEIAIKTEKPLVSGTTGHSNQGLLEIAAKSAPILWSANTSIGISVLSELVKEGAEKLGEGYDVEISDIHHNRKKDVPSGTSIILGKSVAEGRKIDFVAAKSINRNGERKKGEIGFSSVRGGGVCGEHRVMFIGEDEYVELRHVSLTRALFAKGAVKAAIWLSDKENSLYSIYDVIYDRGNTR